MSDRDKERPVLLDNVGKLCKEGREVADYLWQVPDDEAQRRRLRQILDDISKDKAMVGRKEAPIIVAEMKQVLDQRPSTSAAEQLQAGFDRLARLWMSAKSGLF